MPRRVEKVPNPWEPYMDGSIWEFTEEEWRAMPPLMGPHLNQDGEVFGTRCMTWYIRGAGDLGDARHYVRFYELDSDTYRSPDYLAGWKS